MSRPLASHWTFFRQFWRNFHTTGSAVPSSRFLSSALCHYIRNPIEQSNGRPRRILEVGPGTGPVTRHIVAAMEPTDQLDLVELNDEFVRSLRHQFANDPALQKVSGRCRVLHQRMEELPLDQPYDVIVSGLPLNNFAVADVEQILSLFGKLLCNGGTLSFFEYIAVRSIKGVVCSRPERERLGGIGRALSTLLDGQEIRRDRVWLNVPPAWVHHVRYQGQA